MSGRVIKARIFIEYPSLRGNRELTRPNATLTRLEYWNCHSWDYCYAHLVVVRFPRSSFYNCFFYKTMPDILDICVLVVLIAKQSMAWEDLNLSIIFSRTIETLPI
jgi:hypothetical protein